MLKLDIKEGNFKRYNNERGYEITVDSSSPDKKYYKVFSTGEFDNKEYLPIIMTENYNKDGSYSFEISNVVRVNKLEIDEAITELEKYLDGYKVAKESIEEFKRAIKENTI